MQSADSLAVRLYSETMVVRFDAPAQCSAAAVLSCAGVFTSVSISLFATIYAKISANLNAWENYDKPTKIEDAIVRCCNTSRCT